MKRENRSKERSIKFIPVSTFSQYSLTEHSHRTFSITRTVMAREERKKCLSFVITITLFTNPLEEVNLLPLQTFSVSWTSNLYSVMKRGEREHSERNVEERERTFPREVEVERK